MPDPGWYYRFSAFLHHLFGKPVYKLPVDAGFSCPNRDGSTGWGGCTFCDNRSFSPQAGSGRSITDQLLSARQGRRKAAAEGGYLAYFQSYTNTYRAAGELKALYDEALAVPGIIGLSVATRPDCVNEEIMAILADYARRGYHVWVEYGLQSIHDRTLARINRGHDSRAFIDAVNLTSGRGIYTCAHIILGLPGEDRDDMLQTAAALNRLPVDGLKIHHLQILKGTAMEADYRAGRVAALTLEAYLQLVCDFLERTAAGIVIQRLVGEVLQAGRLLAPHWGMGKSGVLNLLERELIRRGTYQGIYA